MLRRPKRRKSVVMCPRYDDPFCWRIHPMLGAEFRLSDYPIRPHLGPPLPTYLSTFIRTDNGQLRELYFKHRETRGK